MRPPPVRSTVLGSPVIDAGAATSFTTDQRGLPRVVGNAPDIGAVEAQNEPPVVISSADTGAGSLRNAITYGASGTTITFATNLSGATILLHTVPLPAPVRDTLISWRDRATLSRCWATLNASLLELGTSDPQNIRMEMVR